MLDGQRAPKVLIFLPVQLVEYSQGPPAPGWFAAVVLACYRLVTRARFSCGGVDDLTQISRDVSEIL